MRWLILMCALSSAGCAVQPSPFASYADQACSNPAFQPERADCMKIAMLALAALANPRPGQKKIDSVFAALQPYSPYGPTNRGWRGISPGRKPGEIGAVSLADGVMFSVQMLDATSQVSARTPSAEEIAAAIGRGMYPVHKL